MTQSNNNNTQVPIYVLHGRSLWPTSNHSLIVPRVGNEIQEHLRDVDDGAYNASLLFGMGIKVSNGTLWYRAFATSNVESLDEVYSTSEHHC